MNEKVVLGGPPVLQIKQRQLGILSYQPPPGAAKKICRSCGGSTWIGVTQLAYLAEHPEAEICCFNCLGKAGSFPGQAISLGGVSGTYHLAQTGTNN